MSKRNSLIENNGEEFVITGLNGAMHDAYSEAFISEFIETFESNKKNKVEKAKKPKATTKKKGKLEELLENENEHENTDPRIG